MVIIFDYAIIVTPPLVSNIACEPARTYAHTHARAYAHARAHELGRTHAQACTYQWRIGEVS